MELLAWKLRVSTLWIFLGVGMLAAMFAMVMPADVLSTYLATGEFEGEKIDATMLALMVGLFCLLPLAMAFVTLALRDPINRYANAILGVVATGMWTWDLAEHVSKEPEISGGPLMTLTLIIAGLLIVWHAWKWPKPAEQDVRDRRPASTPEHRAAGTRQVGVGSSGLSTRQPTSGTPSATAARLSRSSTVASGSPRRAAIAR